MSERMLSQDEIDSLVKEKPSSSPNVEINTNVVPPKALALFDYLEPKLGETIALLTGVEATTRKYQAQVQPAVQIENSRLLISLGNINDGQDIIFFMEETVGKQLLGKVSEVPGVDNIWNDNNIAILGRVFEALATDIAKGISTLVGKHYGLAVALPNGLSGLQDFLNMTKEYLIFEYSLVWEGSEVGTLGFIVDNSEANHIFTMMEEKVDEVTPSIDELIESMDEQDDVLSHFIDAEEEQSDVVVKPVHFAPLGGSDVKLAGDDPNLDIIIDLPVTLTVELGRTHKTLKDILNLKPGSVVELERLAGEPVDVLANGVFIAKGEVVVIDETFGVKITEIASKDQRMNKIK